MANIQCDSCEELRQNAPNFMVNGFGNEECKHLKKNEGLGGNNDNCTDVHDMDDCLVGMMDREVDAYEPCDWKEFMHNFIPNVWATLKAIICWLCGLQCKVNVLMNGISLKISEDDSGESYIVAGKGVSFLGTGTGARESQVSFTYIGGALCEVTGSLLFHEDDFTEAQECYNFDDGSDMHKRSARKGNSIWNKTSGDVSVMEGGGELLYEIRISLKQYPEIKKIFGGIAAPSGGGAYQVNLAVFNAGEYAYGQHGNCNENGVGENGHDNGHLVKDNYIYVQARMVNISYLYPRTSTHTSGGRYSPKGFMGIRLNKDEIEC